MAQLSRSYIKKIWKRRRYYFTLEWVHPFWLRAVVSLLIALPLFVFFVIGTTAVALLVPLIVLIKFFGITFGFLLWLALYIALFMVGKRWFRRHERTRPRRRVRAPR